MPHAVAASHYNKWYTFLPSLFLIALFPCCSNCHYRSDAKTLMTDPSLIMELKIQTVADRLGEEFLHHLILYPNMVELQSQVTNVELCHNHNAVTLTLGIQEHFHHNKMPCKH
jgi:hypothetical protein